MNRREFVLTSTAAGIAAAAQASPSAQAPAVVRSSVKPLVISSANGHQYKNGGTKTCVETAFALMTQGKDVLDALIAGVNIVELDPLEDSVGYGGLPNADGSSSSTPAACTARDVVRAASPAWRACARRRSSRRR